MQHTLPRQRPGRDWTILGAARRTREWFSHMTRRGGQARLFLLDTIEQNI